MNQEISDLQQALSSLEKKHQLLKEAFVMQAEKQAEDRTNFRIEREQTEKETEIQVALALEEREKLENQVNDLKLALENIHSHATWAIRSAFEGEWDAEAEYEASNT